MGICGKLTLEKCRILFFNYLVANISLNEKIDRDLLLASYRQQQSDQFQVDRKFDLLNKILLKHFKIKKVSYYTFSIVASSQK